jgi:hypothetical protein
MTLSDLDFRMRMLQHFQKYFFRETSTSDVKDMMLHQAKRTVADIKTYTSTDKALAREANKLIKDYRLQAILKVV